MIAPLGFGRRLLQVTSLTTAALILPTSVQAWNLVPEPAVDRSEFPQLAPAKLAQLQESNSGLLSSPKLDELKSMADQEAPPLQRVELAAIASTGAADGLYEAAMPVAKVDPFAATDTLQPEVHLPPVDLAVFVDAREKAIAGYAEKRIQVAQSRSVEHERKQPSRRQPEEVRRDREKPARKSPAVDRRNAKTPSERSKSEQVPQFATASQALGVDLESLGPEEMLSLADTTWSEGDHAAATVIYLSLLDMHPGTPAARLADESLTNLAKNAQDGQITTATVNDFLALLPEESSWRTTAARCWLSIAWRVSAHVAKLGKDDAVASERYEHSARLSRALMEEQSEDPVNLLAAREYLYAARGMGRETTAASVAYLQERLSQLEPGSGLRHAIESELAVHMWKFEQNRAESMLLFANLVDGFEHGHLQGQLSGEETPVELQAAWHFAVGYAYYQLNIRDKAKERFSAVIDGYEDLGSITDWSRYFLAFTRYLQSGQDPFVGQQELQATLTAKPDTSVADLTLYMLGNVYYSADDHEQARQTWEQLRQLFPHGEFSQAAAKALQEMEKRLQQEAPLEGEQTASLAEGDLLCGPYALSRMLQSQDKSLNVEELIEQMGSGTRLVSMEELAQAALEHEVVLSAHEVALEDAHVPFIAHMEPYHFVTVTEVNDYSVAYRDVGKPLQRVTRAEFQRQFTGKALLTLRNELQARLLTGAEMVATLGGCSGASSAHLPETSDISVECPNNDDCKKCDACCPPPQQPGQPPTPPPPPMAGGGAASKACYDKSGSCGADPPGGNPNGAGPNKPGGACPSGKGNPPTPPGDTSKPRSLNPDERIGINTGAPGSSGGFNPRQGAQIFEETEVAFKVQGSQSIEFTRHFTNNWGYANAYYLNADKPYHNHIGRSWKHNYSSHLRVSASSGNYVVYADRLGNTSLFYYASTSGGYKEYTYAGYVKPSLLHAVIKEDTSTGEFLFERPGDSVVKFSAPLGTDKYCRMLSITDLGGNAITLSYDDTVRTPYGVLTKVAAPGSDNRYLDIQYDGSDELITKVRFMAGTTEVRFVNFGYSSGNLTSVTRGKNGVSGASVLFTYGNPALTNDGGVTYYYPYYIASVRDRAGVYTNFEFTHEYRTGNGFMVKRARIMYDSGLDVVSTKLNLATSIYDLEVVTRSRSDYDSGTSSYSGNPYTKWTTTANTGQTSSAKPAYFRIFTSPQTGSTAYKQWSYGYDSEGRLTSITTPDSQSWETRSYTGTHQLNMVTHFGTTISDNDYANGTTVDAETVTLKDGTKVYYYYDSLGRVTRAAHPGTSASDPPGSTDGVKYEYNSVNQMTKITDQSGKSWNYRYDSRGNLTKTILPGDSTSSPTYPVDYAYNDYGVITQMKDQLGKFTYYIYSEEGCSSCGGSAGLQLAEVEDDDGHTTTFEYDANGHQTKVTDALSRESAYFYDSMGQLTRVEDLDGRASTMHYDILGRLTAQVDPTGKRTEYAYDFMSRVSTVTNVDVRPGVDIGVSYFYDDRGNLTKVTDGNGNDTSYFYSTANLLTKTTDDIGKNIFYYYDTKRRLTKTGAGSSSASPVDPVEYFFDTKGHMTKVTYTNGGVSKSVEYYYSNYGELTRVLDWLNPGVSPGHYFEYDATTGLMTRYRDFDDNPSGTRQKLDYAYNHAGQVTSMTDYDGNVTTYTYTDTGELSTLTAPGSKVWDFDYNAIHQRTQVLYPNGMKAVYGYDTANRLTKIEYNDGAGSPTVLDGWEYDLADDGNILRMASLTSSQWWDYGYDGKNRLTSAIRANASGVPQFREGYTYDAGDNMLTKQLVSLKEGIKDNFTDGDYTASPAWTVSAGTWAVDSTGKYLKNTGTTADQLRIGNTEENVELWGRYRIDAASANTDYIEFTMLYSFDHSPTDYMSVRVHPDKIQFRERYNNVWDTEDVTIASAQDQWYQIYIRLDGATAEVWRGKDGEGLALVGRITDVQTVNTSRVYINTAGNIQANFDDLYYAYRKGTADSFTDDFADNNYTSNPAWSAGGSWSAASGYAGNTSATGNHSVSIGNTSGDNQLKLSVKKTSSGGSLRLYHRYIDSSNKVYVRIEDSAISLLEQTTAGGTVTKATASATTTINTWYDYHVISDGKHIVVWRGPQGGATELLLQTDAATVLGTASLSIESRSATAHYDNVQFIANDPSTQSMAYNGANELTSSVTGAITTTYTYDDWGRTISKDDGTHTATFTWRFGDKLKQYDTTFPDESSVAFNYDGLGKRRLKLSPVTGYTDAAFTWYRWDVGWNMIGEYAAGTDTGTEWDVGALTRWYQAKVAHADGDPDSASHYFQMPDLLGTPIATYDHSKQLVARLQSTAFGSVLCMAGQRMDLGYTGHKWDGETKSFYAPFRNYGVAQLRWFSRDPLGMVDGPNVYTYVNNQPTIKYDMLGLMGPGPKPQACGMKRCNRPIEDYPKWWYYVPFAGIHHSYIDFGDGTGSWGGTDEHNLNDPCKRCRPVTKKSGGSLATSGKSCSSATCDDIENCIRNLNYGHYDRFNNNCQHMVDKGLSSCCLN